MPARKSRPARSATGAVSSKEAPKQAASKEVTTPAPNKAPVHQTHGGYTPITGPIRSARQLLRTTNGNLAKGTIASFKTLAEYTAYLKTLTAAQLARHAVEEAHIVAIDNRDKLIKRLEGEWSGHAFDDGNPEVVDIPKHKPFTDDQLLAQETIRRQLLGKR